MGITPIHFEQWSVTFKTGTTTQVIATYPDGSTAYQAFKGCNQSEIDRWKFQVIANYNPFN